ncbi:hypothetical protein EIL50_04890 [bacterium NHP-B]|nr:hypothetical protein EIL50_04890 [bacterium NHP-B]
MPLAIGLILCFPRGDMHTWGLWSQSMGGRFFILALGLLFAGNIYAADPKLPAQPKVKEAARIGDKVVTQEEILLQMRRDLGEPIMDLRKSNPAQFAQYYKLYRDQIVGMRLLSDEAVKHEALILEDPKVKDQLEQMRRSFLTNAFVSQYIEKRITPASLQEAFNKHPQEMVSLSRIVLNDEKTAKSVILALKTRSFADLAGQYSKDTKANKDGSTEPMLMARLDGKLRAHVAGLKPGGHSMQPLELGGKWFVIKLDKKFKANFEQARPVLRDFVAMKELQTLMASLRTKEDVKLFDLDGNETKDSLLSPAGAASPAPAKAAGGTAAGKPAAAA